MNYPEWIRTDKISSVRDSFFGGHEKSRTAAKAGPRGRKRKPGNFRKLDQKGPRGAGG
jgi:hypothetical protein